MDEGTRTASTVIATTNSVRSNRGVTPLKRARPGINLVMPSEGWVEVLIGYLLI
jgi:hypothetical protein